MHRLAAVVVAVVVGIVAPPAVAAEPPLPDGITVRFGEDVSPVIRWQITAGIDRAWETFAPHIAEPETFDAVIVVVGNAEDAAREWSQERDIPLQRARDQFTARSSSYAGLATSGLTVIITGDEADPGVTIHEFVHLVQHQIAGDAIGARWISEGAAEWFRQDIEYRWGISGESADTAFAAIADEWATTLAACALGAVPQEAETCRWAAASLETLERAGPFDIGGGAVSAYARASVGFRHLVATAGVDGYICYLREMGGGEQWQDAFLTCIGSRAATFYWSFDRYRARGFVAEVSGPPQRWL